MGLEFPLSLGMDQLSFISYAMDMSTHLLFFLEILTEELPLWLSGNKPDSSHDMGSIPGLAQWVKDLLLLWLWHSLAAIALIQPLAWEPPYAMGVALKR